MSGNGASSTPWIDGHEARCAIFVAMPVITVHQRYTTTYGSIQLGFSQKIV